MRKAFIIIKGWGSYSDRGTEPVRVYLDEGRAIKIMEQLENIQGKYEALIKPYTSSFDDEVAKRLAPEIKTEYAALGFDATWEDDWELAEAELDDRADGQ